MKIFIARLRAVTKLHPLVIKKLKNIANEIYTVSNKTYERIISEML